MKVLIDECSPSALKKAGWAGKQNGELLGLAESSFNVLVTIDTNLAYQQNLADRQIAIVILHSASNRLEYLRQYFPDCVSALERIKPGEIVHVGANTASNR